jgi:hypothetical protein
MLTKIALQAKIVNPIVDLKVKAQKWLSNKIDNAVASVFEWALAKPAVQYAIADKFSGSTAMCRVLRDAIEHGIEDHGIDADNVEGLDSYVNEALENFEVDADNVKGLEQMVNVTFEEMISEALDSHEVEAKDVVNLDAFITEQLEGLEVEAENVKGLERAIDEAHVEAFQAFTPDNIVGLDVAVRNIITENLQHGDLADELTMVVCGNIAEKLTK